MKKLLALIVGIAASTCALADPTFSLGGYTGPVKIKFSNYENLDNPLGTPCTTIAVGCMNYGILDVTQIVNATNNAVLWTKGQGGGFLSGVFDGITVASVTNVGGAIHVNSTGGVVNLYLNSTAIDPTQGSAGYAAGGGSLGSLQYHTVTDLGGSLFLSLAFDAPCDNTGAFTVCGQFNSNTQPFSGSVLASYLSVTGGSNAAMFDTNGEVHFGVPSDFLSANTFCPNGDPNCGTTGNWQLLSDDPIRGNVRGVPEPGSLALVGLALFGAGLSARRGRKS